MTVVRPARAPQRDQAGGQVEAVGLERLGHRRGVVQLGVAEQAGHHHRDDHVEHGADGQRAEDADGQVALRPADLLGGGGDHVEADEGEEHDGGAEADAEQAVVERLLPEQQLDHWRAGLDGGHRLGRLGGRRDERAPVARLDRSQADGDEQQHHRDLDGDQEAVEACAELHPDDRDHGERGHHQRGGHVDRRAVTGDAGGEGERQQLDQVLGPALGHRRSAEGEFEHQVPADDPGDQLAQGGVGEGVGAAGHRHGAGQLGVAQPGEGAGDRGDHEGQRDGRTGLGGGGHPGEHEDTGADGDPDAEDGQVEGGQVAAELVPLHLGVADALLDRLGLQDAHAAASRRCSRGRPDGVYPRRGRATPRAGAAVSRPGA
jgi:hypothetical protein